MKHLALRILLITLGLIGVLLAVLVVLDLDRRDDIMMTAWYVVLADIYLVASLVTRETWIRAATWVLTGVTTIYSMIYTWVEFGDEWMMWTESSPTRLTTYGLMNNVLLALHTLIVTLLLIGFLSRALPYAVERTWLRRMFSLTLVVGLLTWASWVVINFIPYQARNASLWDQIAIALSILAASFAAVVIIGAITESARLKRLSGSSAVTEAELETLVTRIVDKRLTELGVTLPAASQPTPPADQQAHPQ